MGAWVQRFMIAVVLGVGVQSLLIADLAEAQTTAYVTDDLEITMRSGQGNDFRITRLLRSGTALEVLERGETWTRVRAGGEQGWVRSLYLQAEPGAAMRLERATQQLAQLREKNRELNETLARVEAELAELTETREALVDDNQRMQHRLQEAGEGLTLVDENQALRKQVIDLERDIQDLTRSAERTADRERQDWFIAGAGVIAAGMLIGILVTRIRWRKRSSWGDL